jgi:hypothetical protein
MHFTTSGFPPEIIDQWKLTAERFNDWVQNELFSPDWWILLALFLLNVYLWWKAADKARLPEYILFTAVIIAIVIVLDEIGDELTLWHYPTDIFPLFPPMTAINLSSLPFLYTFIYRYARTWKAFLIANAAASVVFCFAFEPVFIWVGMYKLLNWESWWGLPLYFLIPVAAKSVTKSVYSISEKKTRV